MTTIGISLITIPFLTLKIKKTKYKIRLTVLRK